MATAPIRLYRIAHRMKSEPLSGPMLAGAARKHSMAGNTSMALGGFGVLDLEALQLQSTKAPTVRQKPSNGEHRAKLRTPF